MIFSSRLEAFDSVTCALFAKNLIKTLKHGILHEKLLVLAKSTSFDGLSQNAILFAKNLIKTLKHGSLHKKWLVLAKSTSFDGVRWLT